MSKGRLLYVHGFRSSPTSSKATLLRQETLKSFSPLFEYQFQSPQLPSSPMKALRLLSDLVNEEQNDMVLIGSSLGGFYTTILVERALRRSNRRLRGVLLNPGIFPARDLARYAGQQMSFWHFPDQIYEFSHQDLDELHALEAEMKAYNDDGLLGEYALVACKGDDTLDWREMVQRFRNKTIKIVEGSDHGISDFEDHLPFVLDFITSK